MLKLIACGLVGILILGLGYWWWVRASQTKAQPIQDRERLQVMINNHRLTVEAVTSPASITLGLGGRSEIGADGMLFMLPQEIETSFWMKGMQFDLDLVWLRDNQVVGVTAQVPALPPETPPEKLPLYASPGRVDMVLEIPAGKAQELGIVTGTNLELK